MLKSPPEVRPLPRIYLQQTVPRTISLLIGKVRTAWCKLERNGAGDVLVTLEDGGEHGVEDRRVDHHGPLVLAAKVGTGRAEAVWARDGGRGSAARKSRRWDVTRTSVGTAVANAGVGRVVVVGEHVADDLLDAGAQDLEPLAHQHLRRRARGVGWGGVGCGGAGGGQARTSLMMTKPSRLKAAAAFSA